MQKLEAFRQISEENLDGNEHQLIQKFRDKDQQTDFIDERQINITDIALYTTREELYVSDNFSQIHIIDIKGGRISDIKTISNPNQQVTKNNSLLKISIEYLSFSPNESFLGVCYSTGCCQIIFPQTFTIQMNLIDYIYDVNSISPKLPKILLADDMCALKNAY